MPKHRIYRMSFSRVYPLHVQKAERKNRSKDEVDQVIRWLTGYSQTGLENQIEHPVGQVPESFALLALMHLHRARMTAREDASGGLLLLEEQDRSLWDRQEIERGLSFLSLSAQGDNFSRYHAEAGIAAEHCLAPSFGQTRWDNVVECYELLERVAPSALHRLNRAVAIAQLQGPDAGLAVLDGLEPPSWLAGSYLWAAALADLHRRCGHVDAAEQYRDAAFESAPTTAVAELLRRRLAPSVEPARAERHTGS